MAERLDPQFAPLLSSHDTESLRLHRGTVYGMWADFRLAYLNPAWFDFARANCGEPAISTEWGLGRVMLDSVPEVLRDYYRNHLLECLESGTEWSHTYECSSDSVYRAFHQIVYPLCGRGLLAVNSLVAERSHRRVAMPADEPLYLDKNRLISQCAHCRRVKRTDVEDQWDWVPAWVSCFPENTSHTICPTCFTHHYK